MTETSINYAKALYELSVPETAVSEAEHIFEMEPELKKALENPLVSLKEKEQVINRIFPDEIRNFLKVICKYQRINKIDEIFDAYGEYCRRQKGILQAVLIYVTKPEETQEKKIKEFLLREFDVKEVKLTMKEDKALIGGFILKAGDTEFDWSFRGRYMKLKQKLTRR